MNLIKINDIRDKPCDLYDADGNLIGKIETELQLNDIRLQICEFKKEGCYIKFTDENGEEKKIDITKDGYFSEWPEGFFDTSEKQLIDLFHIRRS